MREALQWLKTSGSKHFLDPRSLGILLAPTAVIVSVLSSSSGTWLSTLAWTVANLLAILIVFLLVVLVRAAREKLITGQLISLSAVFLLSATIGGTKSLLTNLFASGILGFSEAPGDLLARTLSGALAGVIAIPLVAAFAATREELERDRDELITRRMQRELRIRAEREEEESLDALVRELKSLRSKLKRGNQRADAVDAQLVLLKELSQSRVRPLSHRLFEQIENSFPQVGWRELLASGAKDGAPIGFLVGLNLLTLPRNIEVLGLQFGAAYAFTTSTLLLILLSLIGRVLSRFGSSSEITTGLSIAISVAASYSIAWLIYPPLGPNFLFLVGALVIWLGQSGLVFVVVRELFRLRSEARIDFDLEEVEQVGAVATSQIERAKMGKLLHGQVQSRLMSLALRARLGDGVKAELVIAELDEIIFLISSPPVAATLPNEILTKLASQWDGFIEFGIKGVELLSPWQLSALEPIVEEAVSNAYRHGLATNIKIEFSDEDGQLRLQVIDDGTGPRGGSPGIGSKLFDELSQGWSIAPGDKGGSILSFTF